MKKFYPPCDPSFIKAMDQTKKYNEEKSRNKIISNLEKQVNELEKRVSILEKIVLENDPEYQNYLKLDQKYGR